MTTEQRSLYSHVKYFQTAAIPLVQSEIRECHTVRLQHPRVIFSEQNML